MNKAQFLTRLRTALGNLSAPEVKASLDYYAEMIDDRVEGGMTEEAAVAALGQPEAVAREILMDMPLPRLIQTNISQKPPRRGWEIALLILGAPLWLSLGLALLALLCSLYVTLWAILITLWAVVFSLGGTALGCGILFAVTLGTSLPTAMLHLGVGLLLMGLCLFAVLLCAKLTCLTVRLTKALTRWIKSLFIKKEANHDQNR